MEQLKSRVEDQVLLNKSAETLLEQFEDDIEELPTNTYLKRRQQENQVCAPCTEPNMPIKVVKKPHGEYKIYIETRDDHKQTLQDIDVDQPFLIPFIETVWKSRNAEKKRKGRAICFEMKLFMAKHAVFLNKPKLTAKCYTEAFIQFPSLPKPTIVQCIDHRSFLVSR